MITDQMIVDAMPIMNRYAWKFTRDREASKDLVQDTIVRILEYRDTRYTDQGNFNGWVYVIMRNLFGNNVTRRNPRARHTHQIDTLEHLLPAPGNQEPRHQLRDVQRAWDTLPGAVKETAWPVIMGDEYSHVAAALGMKVGTVKSRVSRARAVMAAATQ